MTSWMTLSAHARRVVILCSLILAGVPAQAFAQQTISEALTFLFGGRPLPVDPFVPRVPDDRSPAVALADALRHALTVRPTTSPAGGLSYEWRGDIASLARPTESFGPVFTARAVAMGARRASISFTVRQVEFTRFNGVALDDDSEDVDQRLVAAASSNAGEVAPFDVQSVALRLRARTAMFPGQVGVTERLDFVVAVPLLDLSLSGERVDRYRGTLLPQATAFASASGLGDVVMRGSFQIVRDGPRALAATGEVRLPTGSTVNSLGSGERRITPGAAGSIELRKMTVHAELGYSFGERSDGVQYGGAITVAPLSRVTLSGEVLGRTEFDAPGLGVLTVPHPTLVGVSTRLAAGEVSTSHRIAAVLGIKWNVAAAWLLNAHVVRPLTDDGFTAPWSPSITFDYFFQQR